MKKQPLHVMGLTDPVSYTPVVFKKTYSSPSGYSTKVYFVVDGEEHRITELTGYRWENCLLPAGRWSEQQVTGKLKFLVFDSSPWRELLLGKEFDMRICHANEAISTEMWIHKCTLVGEKQSLSIEDLTLESIVSFKGTEVTPWKKVMGREDRFTIQSIQVLREGYDVAHCDSISFSDTSKGITGKLNLSHYDKEEFDKGNITILLGAVDQYNNVFRYVMGAVKITGIDYVHSKNEIKATHYFTAKPLISWEQVKHNKCR